MKIQAFDTNRFSFSQNTKTIPHHSLEGNWLNQSLNVVTTLMGFVEEVGKLQAKADRSTVVEREVTEIDMVLRSSGTVV